MNFFTDAEKPRVDERSIDTSKVRIGRVNLPVADLDRGTDFYRNVLGMTVSFYGRARGVPTVFLAFDDDQHDLALTWFSSEAVKSSFAGQRALSRFAIVYPDEIALARAVCKVLELGGLIDDARDHGDTISINLRDPDGNGIELSCDRSRRRRFDLIADSEPLNLKQWLKDHNVRAETPSRSNLLTT